MIALTGFPKEVLTLQGENAERWRTLCEQAATEQDPQKLVELIQEINRLLAEKGERLRKLNDSAP